MQEAVEYFLEQFKNIEAERKLLENPRRIGAELKFPLVNLKGEAAKLEDVKSLWKHLEENGWEPIIDPYAKGVVGARKEGEKNHSIASCETGFCKTEFSLAHVETLHTLQEDIDDLREVLREFSERNDVIFLCYGIQPFTHPGKELLMKKSRNIFWDRLFKTNNIIPEEEGTDVLLFTVSASSQVHVDVKREEAIDALNVFNGLSGAQIALTANSNVWKNHIDSQYKSVGEIFWDLWLTNHPGRFGVPERKFRNMEEYLLHLMEFPPVYVKRGEDTIGLPHCPSFKEFYSCSGEMGGCHKKRELKNQCGLSADGKPVSVRADQMDFDQHLTFFWHNARISPYFTLENRVNDQQPPGDILVISALTLGIMENLDGAKSLMDSYPWELLREMRFCAIREGLSGKVAGISLSDISSAMLKIAEAGLRKRGFGEQKYLDPLWERLQQQICPADMAAEIFRSGGAEGLVERFRL
ncbi:MAG: glutamate-cysteine ligase family protein [Thermodesulfobacteriota bacterium]|nr:glutamate-cysteine ligase family protein [Thermodesulfobacteriota bacterium]